MAKLVIPVTLEENFAQGDGSTKEGFPIDRALQLDQEEVANLYSISGGKFNFAFQEHGVAYNETTATDYKVELSLSIKYREQPSFSLKVESNPLQMWGLNFAGRVLVKHKNGDEKIIYLPGTRTYDPAGLTGDPHASERIGPSCSRTQIGITLAEIVMSSKGADLKDINTMHDKNRAVVKRYHGREVLFDWMKLQVEEAVYKKTDVTPYPEYIKTLIRNGKFELGKAREHTTEYLESYNRGAACPPVQYYRKVAKKDKVEDLLSADKLASFNEIVG